MIINIGIIVYSQTGNTFLVANKFKETLVELGHTVKIERIEPIDSEEKDLNKIKFKSLPDLDRYDSLIFGAPVQAFSLAPVMSAYLKELRLLKNKKIICYVTMFFPFKWMGGKRAISMLKSACTIKEGSVLQSGIVNWSSKNRENEIIDLVKNLSNSF